MKTLNYYKNLTSGSKSTSYINETSDYKCVNPATAASPASPQPASYWHPSGISSADTAVKECILLNRAQRQMMRETWDRLLVLPRKRVFQSQILHYSDWIPLGKSDTIRSNAHTQTKRRKNHELRNMQSFLNHTRVKLPFFSIWLSFLLCLKSLKKLPNVCSPWRWNMGGVTEQCSHCESSSAQHLEGAICSDTTRASSHPAWMRGSCLEKLHSRSTLWVLSFFLISTWTGEKSFMGAVWELTHTNMHPGCSLGGFGRKPQWLTKSKHLAEDTACLLSSSLDTAFWKSNMSEQIPTLRLINLL